MCVVKSAALVSGFKYPSPTALPEAKQYRSEEHTSELQSLRHLVCRLLLEKKKDNLKIQRILVVETIECEDKFLTINTIRMEDQLFLAPRHVEFELADEDVE